MSAPLIVTGPLSKGTVEVQRARRDLSEDLTSGELKEKEKAACEVKFLWLIPAPACQTAKHGM